MPMATDWRVLLPFYLEGREAAAEEFEVEDEHFDMEALAGSVKGLEGAEGIRARALDSGGMWSSDAADSRPDWLREHRGEIRAAGVAEGEAFDAWLKGYAHECAVIIEAALVEALGEEDTAVETPSGKRSAKQNPSRDDATTYADYYKTGIQDCQNTIAQDDFDSELAFAVKAFRKHRQDVSKLAAEAVKEYWVQSEPEAKETWMEQNEDEVREEGLKPDRAYEFWGDGWRVRAQSYLAEWIVEGAEEDE